MTNGNPTTILQKNIRFCPDTRDYEILIDGQIIGYAPTKLRGYAIANEFVYLQLTAAQGNPAELTPEEAEALLAVQMTAVPVMLELAAQAELERLEVSSGVAEARRPLPAMHPVRQLVDEAAWWTEQMLRAA